MSGDLTDGVAVAFVRLLYSFVRPAPAARRIEETLERRTMRKALATGNFRLGGKRVNGG